MTDTNLASGLPSDLIAEAISWRRHLHQHPELAFNEEQTADFVASQLDRSGLEVHRGIAGTGVVGTLRRGKSPRTIAIRADMDALPIEEHSGVLYSSCVPGVMHACGHDGHVAIALAAAHACARLSNLDGTVHFVFQPGEEGAGGARRMIEEGLFQRFPCDVIYALHNWPALPLGTYVARDGPMMAASAVFEVTISGSGCHGAMPHEGTDSVLAGCQLVSALQSIVSRNIDPMEASVVSTTQIHAGSAYNVIPDSCVIRGTTRWFDKRTGDILERRITELSKSIGYAFGCAAQIRYNPCYPATVNDAVAASLVRDVASVSPVNLRQVDAQPSMGAEDFAFMGQVVPSCYLWLGAARASEDYGLHSHRYDFNDEVIPRGVALWVSLVRKSLTDT